MFVFRRVSFCVLHVNEAVKRLASFIDHPDMSLPRSAILNILFNDEGQYDLVQPVGTYTDSSRSYILAHPLAGNASLRVYGAAARNHRFNGRPKDDDHMGFSRHRLRPNKPVAIRKDSKPGCTLGAGPIREGVASMAVF